MLSNLGPEAWALPAAEGSGLNPRMRARTSGLSPASARMSGWGTELWAAVGGHLSTVWTLGTREPLGSVPACLSSLLLVLQAGLGPPHSVTGFQKVLFCK